MIKPILIFIIATFMLGCTMLIEPKVKFILRNDSDYDMKIKFFEKSIILDSLNIESQNQYVSEKFDSDHEGNITPFNTFSDSIVILFSNKKYIVQYCEGQKLHYNFIKCGKISKNLMDFGLGKKKLNKLTGNYNLTITFDNLDYEKAIPY